jgi:hypothetical protein
MRVWACVEGEKPLGDFIFNSNAFPKPVQPIAMSAGRRLAVLASHIAAIPPMIEGSCHPSFTLTGPGNRDAGRERGAGQGDKILSNEAVGPMTTAIGTDVKDDFKLDDARYHKIILMTDADADGPTSSDSGRCDRIGEWRRCRQGCQCLPDSIQRCERIGLSHVPFCSSVNSKSRSTTWSTSRASRARRTLALPLARQQDDARAHEPTPSADPVASSRAQVVRGPSLVSALREAADLCGSPYAPQPSSGSTRVYRVCGWQAKR